MNPPFIFAFFNYYNQFYRSLIIVNIYGSSLIIGSLFVLCSFADTNTERLLITARENSLDENMFNFDSKSINWKEFFVNVHIPAIVKYLF